MTPLPSPLLLVTDRHQARWPLTTVVAEAIEAGVRWIWFRDRDMDAAERRALAGRLFDIAHAHDATLSVGGDVALAVEMATGAAHLPMSVAVAEARRALGASALIGQSAHGAADVENARAAGADYATLSPISASASKPGYGPALGLEGIGRAARCGLPVVALGGIDADNAADAVRAGAAGVAVMGLVMRAERPGAAVETLLARLAAPPARA